MALMPPCTHFHPFPPLSRPIGWVSNVSSRSGKAGASGVKWASAAFAHSAVPHSRITSDIAANLYAASRRWQELEGLFYGSLHAVHGLSGSFRGLESAADVSCGRERNSAMALLGSSRPLPMLHSLSTHPQHMP